MNWKDLKLNSVIFLITNALFFLIGIGTFSKISLKSTVISILISSCFSYFLLSLYLKKNEDCKLVQKNSIFITYLVFNIKYIYIFLFIFVKHFFYSFF